MRHRALLASRSPPRVQPVPVSPAGGHRDRGYPAQPGEGPLGAQPGGVVPGSDQQLPGGIDPHAGQGDEAGCGGGDERGELGVQVIDLGLEGLQAASKAAECGLPFAGPCSISRRRQAQM